MTVTPRLVLMMAFSILARPFARTDQEFLYYRYLAWVQYAWSVVVPPLLSSTVH